MKSCEIRCRRSAVALRIKQIKSVWRLVYGLVNCGRLTSFQIFMNLHGQGETIASTFLLLLIVLYVFGVLGALSNCH